MNKLTCDGYWNVDGNFYDVGMSDIWSYLIRECGKLVESYNYDLFYDIETINKFIRNESEEPGIFWIGFRNSGVDHEDFIKCRCQNDYYYRGLYKIIVEKTNRRCIVTLEKSSAWDFRKEHNIYV